MSFLDSPIDKLSGALGDVGNVLGGTPAPSGAAPDAKPKYYHGEDLGQPPDGVAGSASPKPTGNTSDSMAVDKGLPIQFIHFGFAHLDHTSDFDHKATVEDDKGGQLPQNPATPQSRAIVFRAALEREAILLYGFISSCQNVLKEKEGAEGNKGSTDALGNTLSNPGLGNVMQTASDLLGSTGGSSGPKASDLNPMAAAVMTAGGKIIASPVMYKVVHQTGVDLAQARANYRAFLDNLQKNPQGQKDSKGGLLGNLPGVSDIASGVASAISSVSGELGDILTIIQGIVFKAFDIYVATYTNIAEAQEFSIERACHDMSIQAIRSNTCPIFFPWFVKNPDDSSSSSTPGSNAPLLSTSTSGGGPSLGQQLQDLPGKVKDQAEDAATNQINKFLEVTSDDYWSQPFLNQAFSLDASDPKAPKDQPPPPPKAIGTLVVQAFKTALDMQGKDLGFAEDLVTTIMREDTDFLQTIYQTLLAWDNTKKIPTEDLYSAVRERLLQRLVDLLLDKLTFLQSVKDFSLPFDKKKGKQGGKALDKGTAVGIDELNQQFGQELEPVLKLAMDNLVAELETARSTAVAQNSMTMEVYLGLLPRVLAMLFRDTFFPVWDLLVKKGCPWINDFLGGPVGSAAAAFKDARKGVHDVRDTMSRVKNVADQGTGISADLSGSDAGKYKRAWDTGGIGEDPDGSGAKTAQSTFPLTGRTAAATGGPSTKGEVESVTIVPDSECVPVAN